MLTVKDRHFWKDGKRIFIFGGEIHYFRLPRDQWEDRILKAKAAGMNTVSTLVPWMYHEPIEGQTDLKGRRAAETDLGAFLALLQKHGMYCVLKPGPYVMSEMRNHGLPDWLFARYPQCLGKNKWGQTVSDHYVHLEDETFLRLVEGWYRAVGAVVRPYMEENGGPILMVQLDNEIGMLNWCSGMAEYCDANLAAFQRYVRERYAESYGDKSPEDFRSFVKDPPPEAAVRVNYDLTLYSRLYYKRYFQRLQQLCRRYLGNAMNIVNVHGFDTYDIIKRGREYPSGLSQLLGAAGAENTLTAGDYYLGNICYDNFQDLHLANAFTGAVQNPDQPLFSDEFQGGFQTDTPRLQPTAYDLSARLCIGDGMDGLCYFLLAGGTNPDEIGYYGHRHDWQAAIRRDGSLNTQYPYFAHLGRLLSACGETLAGTDFEPVVELGIAMDLYMSEYMYHDPALNAKREELERFCTDYLYNGMGKGLAVTNLSYRGVSLEAPVRPEEHPVIVLCAAPCLPEEIQRRLLDYVRAGGKLLLYPTVPVQDMLGRPCTVLRDALGCGTDIYRDGMVTVDGVTDVPADLYTDFGNPEGAFAWEQRTGRACGFLRRLGKGTALCYGLGHRHEYYFRDEILLTQMKKLGVEPVYTSDRPEDKLILSSRANAEGGRYLTVINLDEYEKTTHIFRRGKPLFGGRAVTLPPRKGLLLPLGIRFTPGLKVLWSTGELIGLEETPDRITLTVALVQPSEELLLETAYRPLPSGEYTAEVLPEGLRVRSGLDGRLYRELKITLDKRKEEPM